LRIIALQGPNLNRLGLRKPEIYGRRTLAEIQDEMDRKAGELGCTLLHFQSNSEGSLIDWLQEHQDETDAIICNPAGLTNYGLSLRDALAEAERDLAITHLSNVHAREQWRRHDVFAEVANIYLAGLGWRVYLFAIEALHKRYSERNA
jgi:3-dehydroquinate dehydratase-2